MSYLSENNALFIFLSGYACARKSYIYTYVIMHVVL